MKKRPVKEGDTVIVDKSDFNNIYRGIVLNLNAPDGKVHVRSFTAAAPDKFIDWDIEEYRIEKVLTEEELVESEEKFHEFRKKLSGLVKEYFGSPYEKNFISSDCGSGNHEQYVQESFQDEHIKFTYKIEGYEQS